MGDLLNQAKEVRENKLFMKPKYNYKLKVIPGQDLKFTVNKTLTESPYGVFESIQKGDNKVIIKKIKPRKRLVENRQILVERTSETPTKTEQDKLEGSPKSILKGTSQYDQNTENEDNKAKTSQKFVEVNKTKATKVTWGATPPPMPKKKKKNISSEEVSESEKEPATKPKRKYTRRKLVEGPEGPKVKRKYTKRAKVIEQVAPKATEPAIETSGESIPEPEVSSQIYDELPPA